jgi:mycothiol system anti-sigma-R factor
MECEEVLFRLWEYLDRQVPPEEAYAIADHLGRCSGCYPAFCCDRAFLQLLARQRRSCSVPATLSQSVLARLRSL